MVGRGGDSAVAAVAGAALAPGAVSRMDLSTSRGLFFFHGRRRRVYPLRALRVMCNGCVTYCVTYPKPGAAVRIYDM